MEDESAALLRKLMLSTETWKMVACPVESASGKRQSA